MFSYLCIGFKFESKFIDQSVRVCVQSSGDIMYGAPSAKGSKYAKGFIQSRLVFVKSWYFMKTGSGIEGHANIDGNGALTSGSILYLTI